LRRYTSWTALRVSTQTRVIFWATANSKPAQTFQARSRTHGFYTAWLQSLRGTDDISSHSPGGDSTPICKQIRRRNSHRDVGLCMRQNLEQQLSSSSSKAVATVSGLTCTSTARHASCLTQFSSDRRYECTLHATCEIRLVESRGVSK